MDKIFCDINLFTLKSPVYRLSGGAMEQIGSFTLEDLPEALVSICNESNITDVTIMGNAYGDTIAEQIRVLSASKYNYKLNIKVEVQ